MSEKLYWYDEEYNHLSLIISMFFSCEKLTVAMSEISNNPTKRAGYDKSFNTTEEEFLKQCGTLDYFIKTIPEKLI